MTLAEYLDQHRVTEQAFARLVRTSQSQVNRWRKGLRIPRPEMMHRIVAATGGRVMPGDFYGQATTKAAQQSDEVAA